jgi:hypothetical protein
VRGCYRRATWRYAALQYGVMTVSPLASKVLC